MMDGWISHLVANPFYKTNQHYIFKHEFLKLNISPDEEVLKHLKPRENQKWNCPEFLSNVWVEVLSAKGTSFCQTPDFTYEKICEMDFHHLEDEAIDKLFVKMLHEEAVEYGKTNARIFEHWMQLEGVTRYLKKHQKTLKFCPAFQQSQVRHTIRNLVNQWRPVFRQVKIPYSLWYDIAGKYLLQEDVLITEGIVRPCCAPAFYC